MNTMDEEVYRTKYGFSVLDPVSDRKKLAVVNKVLRAYFHKDKQYDKKRTLVREKHVYVPICRVGCLGYMVDVDERRLMVMGSGIPALLFFWLLYHGWQYSDPDTVDTNVVEILSIQDRDEALHTFRSDVSQEELEKLFAKLPCRLTLKGSCGYRARNLYRASRNKHFEFKFNPKEEETSTT